MAVIQVDTTTLKKMQHFYSDYMKDTIPAHSVFSASTNGVTITAYHSGKVLFQGKNADSEAAIWATITKTTPQQTTFKTKSTANLPKDFDKWSVIGSDEVGNGSYFGPLIVVSALVEKNRINELVQLGVKDSKALTDAKIIELAKILKNKLSHVILHVNNEKYNDVQPTMSQGQMKAELHNHALVKLSKQVSPSTFDAILIDQFELPKTYWAHLKGQPKIIKDNVYFATKGEGEHIAVAAASIIARAEFLNALDLLSQQAGMTIPSGAGANVDKVAATLIQKFGVDALYHYSKLHFANTQKAIQLANNQ